MKHTEKSLSVAAERWRCTDWLQGFLLAGCWLAAAPVVWAQTSTDDAAQRERIALERRHADAALDQRRWECSRRFAVTACMNEAQASHRDTVESLGREEEVLDARARQARAAKRLEIIRQKTEALARLSATSASQTADPRPPDAKQPTGASAESTARLPPREKDQSAADRAASQRAAASQRRREEARRQQAQREATRADQMKSMPGLPARPPIPPAKPLPPAN